MFTKGSEYQRRKIAYFLKPVIDMNPTSEPTAPPPPAVLSGTCACGKVAYQSSTLPISITLCHCIECRKASGAPFLAFGLFHNTALQWSTLSLNSDLPLKIKASPISEQGASIAVRGSCGDCGSPLFMKYHCRPDGISVVMGIMDDAGVTGRIVRPKEHIFLGEKARWWDLADDDGMARHEGFTQSFQDRLRAWYAQGCPSRADIGYA